MSAGPPFCWYCSRQLRSFRGVRVEVDGISRVVHKACVRLALGLDEDPHGGAWDQTDEGVEVRESLKRNLERCRKGGSSG